MNKCMISGNIGKDLELRYANSGTAVLDMTVAVKRFGKDEKTDWFNVVAFGKVAENCANYLHKGSKVLVIGSMQFDTYDKSDGSGKGYSSKLIAQEVEFLDSKKSEVGQSNPPGTFEPSDNGYKVLIDDDTPF